MDGDQGWVLGPHEREPAHDVTRAAVVLGEGDAHQATLLLDGRWQPRRPGRGRQEVTQKAEVRRPFLRRATEPG